MSHSQKNKDTPTSEKHWTKIWGFIVKSSPFITVLALALAIYHLTLSKLTDETVQKIKNAVSTQYVGTFPGNMKAITEILSQTRKSLIIVTDVPAYGCYSNPEDHQKYRQILENLAKPDGGIKIRMVFYSKHKRHESDKDQFANETFDKIKKRSTYKHFFEYWKGKKVEPRDTLGFYKMLNQENTDFEDRFSKFPVDIYYTSKDLPVFMWLRDSTEVVFSFRNYGVAPREVSFSSRDRDVIDVLLKIADVPLQESQKYPDTTEYK